MTILKHELRRGRLSLIIWTAVIAFLLVISVMLFPEMKSQMTDITEAFSSMGAFSEAFGMDRLNFGELIGYYATECGNVLGLGGAFFAALLGIGMLCKEERGKTAEFLLTHPVSRARVVTEKLIALMIQVLALNIIVFLLAVGSIALIGEKIPWKEVLLLHAAYLLMQIEIAGICFGVSAFLRRGSAGDGLGIAAVLYAMSIIANITDSVSFLNYLTPFGYCGGADIVSDLKIDGVKLAVGMGACALGKLAAYIKYTRKDIH